MLNLCMYDRTPLQYEAEKNPYGFTEVKGERCFL